jgi:putative toxin-antitoxin system antitoxin component (TIGR02293 family)
MLTHASRDETTIHRASDLLGGPEILQFNVESLMDAHDLIVKGIPSEAIVHLFGQLGRVRISTSFVNAVGMSVRTMQRRRAAPTGFLSLEQSGRAWKFAEIIARAMEVLGSKEAAEGWLEQEALAIDGRRPIDLLSTSAGVEIVEDLLGRLEYGVYT